MHRSMTTRGHWLTSRSWLLLGVALVASCAQTLATSGKVSVTAESVCALRAAAAKHPRHSPRHCRESSRIERDGAGTPAGRLAINA
jgi:hypothetical protein